MKLTFTSLYRKLKNLAVLYDESSVCELKDALNQISHFPLPKNYLFEKYHDVLLFLCAHPADPFVFESAQIELQRIATFIKKTNRNGKSKWINSGLPYTLLSTSYSYDVIDWMIQNQMPVHIDTMEEDGDELHSVLKFTLPEVEKEITAVIEQNSELLKGLLVRKKNTLSFILDEFKRFNDFPALKDFFFDKLRLNFQLKLNNPSLSKSFNKIPGVPVYCHDRLLKNFDHIALLNLPVNKQLELNTEQKLQLVSIIKMNLILLQRETEPVNYLDERSLRYFELERGVSIALFTMRPERQLPIESYVGYTLFRNGYPAAYGGAWMLGPRALFGINIFEWFRGGESGYILCQLLRIFRQVFSVDYFEIEPYQYGLDNPEGITSGAFWFYYKYGFRPLDKSLYELAEKERAKIIADNDYRSGKTILQRFTASNLALQLGNSIPVAMWQIRNKVSEMIHEKFNDNRFKAEQECSAAFMNKTIFKRALDKHQVKVMVDIALVCEAYDWNSQNILRLLEQLVLEKPRDVYNYQKLMLKLFQQIRQY